MFILCLLHRTVKELSDKMQGSELKELLTQMAMTNPHIPNLLNIASRAGVKTPLSPVSKMDEGAFDLDEGLDESKSEWDCLPEQSEINFATATREVFASYFVEHFANYENFIIVPQQSYDQWLRNREHFQNFDKTAFLSDQTTSSRPFYSAFLETSMFSLFIDEKIVTFWEPERAGQSLVVFDSRVEGYRDKSGLAKPPTMPGSRSESERVRERDLEKEREGRERGRERGREDGGRRGGEGGREDEGRKGRREGGKEGEGEEGREGRERGTKSRKGKDYSLKGLPSQRTKVTSTRA